MFVDIDTLNAYGLVIKDDQNDNNSGVITKLVANYERGYLDMCLSVALSDELTDITKDDERFQTLINQVSFDDGRCRSIGLDKGANYYIYSLWLKKQFEDVTSSGVTVMSPESTKQIDPNTYFQQIHNMAADASMMCLEIISENSDDYTEFTEANGLSSINSLL